MPHCIGRNWFTDEHWNTRSFSYIIFDKLSDDSGNKLEIGNLFPSARAAKGFIRYINLSCQYQFIKLLCLSNGDILRYINSRRRFCRIYINNYPADRKLSGCLPRSLTRDSLRPSDEKLIFPRVYTYFANKMEEIGCCLDEYDNEINC